MRFWTSIVENRTEADTCRDGSGSDPLSRRVEPDLMRLTLSAAIPGCFLRFFREAKGLLETLRQRWLRLSRCADDCRLPPLRFECLAKIIRLDLTKTFDLPRGYGSTTTFLPGRRAPK